MATAPSDTTHDTPAGVGTVAFLIIYTVLLAVITSALWISYFT